MTNFEGKSRAVLVFFSLFLLIPFMLSPRVDLEERSKDQQRALQNFEKCKSIDDCVSIFRNVIGDRIYGVEQSARLLAKIRYYVFRDTPTRRVGLTYRRELILTGWNDKNPYGLAKICNPENYDANIQSFVNNHQTLIEWAKKTKVNYYSFIVPSTITLLADRPSTLPESVRNNCKTFQEMRPYSKFNSQKNFFYPFEHYFSKRDDFTYYPNVNFHWGARSSSDVISQWAGKNGFSQLYDLGDSRELRTDSDISSIINLDLTYPSFSYPYMETAGKVLQIDSAREIVWQYNQEIEGRTEHVLVIGNSFTEEGYRHFLPYFNQVTHVNMNRIDDETLKLWLQGYVQEEKVSHIVLVAHSVNGNHFMSRLNMAVN